MKIKLIILSFIFFASLSFAQSNDLYNKFRLAQSFEQAGNLDKAKNILEEIYNEEPNNFQFFEALTKVYIRLKEFDKAITIIEKRLSVNKDDVNLHGLLGSTYFQKGDEEEAKKIWLNALKFNPESVVNYRIIGNYANDNRAYDIALEIYKQGQQKSDQGETFSMDIAYLHSIIMNYEEAIAEYLSILNKSPNQINVVKSRLLNFIRRPEVFEKVEKIVKEKFNKNKTETLYDLLAWIYIENGDFKNSFEYYKILDEIRGNNGAEIYNFALRAYHNKQYEAASKAYKLILDNYPNSPFAVNSKLGFAKNKESVLDEKYTSTENSWKPFYKSEPVKEYDEIILSYNEVIKAYKKSTVTDEAYLRIGTIQFEKLKDHEAARNTFIKLIEISPISIFIVPVHLKLTELEMYAGNLDEAEKYAKKILDISRSTETDKNKANFLLAKIEFFKGNFDFSSKLLNNIVDMYSDNIANDAIELSLIINTNKQDSNNLYKFAEAEFLILQNKFKKAEEIYSELSKNENLFTLKDISALRRAEMFIAENELLQAVSLLEKIAAGENQNIYKDKAVFLLGEIYNYGIKKDDLALQYYQKLLASFPNSLYLDAARENINVLKNKVSDNL